uniref:WD_REPEATS_REGION domain-containing protein n=1 Tax=Elaeophora elaphi TaxID=1147741 RepID=A0A0R3RSX5_9BILA
MDIDGPSSYRSQFGAAKFSRVRWLDLGGQQKKFLTSTYDSRNKEIAAWSFVEDAELTDDLFSCECRLIVNTDVNDLLLYNGTKFAAAMNDGSVRLLEYDAGVIKPIRTYTNMHNDCSCNALCYNNDKIISGGGGGSLISIDLEGNFREVVYLSMASIRSLASVARDIFVSAHLDGQICLWDLRVEAKSSRPVFSCRVTDCFQGTTSLAAHPAEPNVIGFGTEDGGIGFLDTRQSNYLLNAIAVSFPVGTVWEVAFHPVYPSNFYCATGKGYLLHLNAKGSALSNSISNLNSQSRANVWLSPSVRSGNANVTALIDCLTSVNTFNVSTNGIIACADNQMITYIDRKYLA